MPPRSSAASARPRRPWRESRPAAGRPGPTGSARPQQPRLSHDQSTVGHAEIAAIERTGAIRHQQEELARSEEHTSELQSLMRISYAVFCLKKKKNKIISRTRMTRTCRYLQ